MAACVKIPQRHGYSVKFSPFSGQRLACASSENFGITGAGSLFIVEVTPTGPTITARGDWTDALFDVTWSENNPNLAVTGSGDGGVQVWDINNMQAPVNAMKEHTKEVHSVDWSLTRDVQLLLSASWDQTIKLWDASRSSSLSTFTGHNGLVYGAIWSPHIPGCFASVSGDQTVRVWDINKTYMPQVVIDAVQGGEVLTCDWSRYDKNILLTGSVDCCVRGWDIRDPRSCLFELQGHQYAIRRLRCSPFHPTQVATCSYDLTVRLWDWGLQSFHPMETIEHHTEFVCGLDYNLHVPGQLADCSWDQSIVIYHPKSINSTPAPQPR